MEGNTETDLHDLLLVTIVVMVVVVLALVLLIVVAVQQISKRNKKYDFGLRYNLNKLDSFAL